MVREGTQRGEDAEAKFPAVRAHLVPEGPALPWPGVHIVPGLGRGLVTLVRVSVQRENKRTQGKDHCPHTPSGCGDTP